MYTDEEKAFIEYWRTHRSRKKRFFRQVLISIPLGLVLVILIFVNLFSGWYKRASMDANANPSLILLLIISGIIIVAFGAVFTSYHKWDMNETRYKELLKKGKNNN